MLEFKPWLWLSPSVSHSLSPIILQLFGSFRDYQTFTWKPFNWRGLEFTNPLGVAGGMDKNGHLVKHLWTLGVGFVEVGTITPKPQRANPGEIIRRDTKQQALWNKMGFPNRGAKSALRNLKGLKSPHFTPIFVNVGKNRTTPNDKAHEDYIQVIDTLREHADAFVINISSPNTADLRELLQPTNLKGFLAPILNVKQKDGRTTPMLLKLSPDLEDQDLFSVLDISYELGIDGWILTNTTTTRTLSLSFPKEGGVSGKPLYDISKKILEKSVNHLGERRRDKLVISVGGVLTPEDVCERLEMGANLVQSYSALVFSGPFFFRDTFEYAKRKYY